MPIEKLPVLRELKENSKGKFKEISRSEYESYNPQQRAIIDKFNSGINIKTRCSDKEIMQASLNSMPKNFYTPQIQYKPETTKR